MNPRAMTGSATAVEPGQGIGSQQLRSLERAFALFNETTTRLEDAHRRLERRVAEIDRELEARNRELAEANQSLAAKIAELDQTRRYLDSVIAGIQDGIASVDGDGRILTWNRAAEEITGIPATRAVGSPLRDLLGDETASRVRFGLAGGEAETEFETRWRTETGRDVHARVRTAALVGGNRESIGALAVFQDLTRVRLLEEKVRRRERLSALGELAAGVAHEMRNPLTTVRGYVQLLPRQAGDPEFLREMTRNVLAEIDRLSGLTGELLDLARPAGDCRVVVPAAEVLAEVVDFHANGGEYPGMRMLPERLDPTVQVSIDRDRWKQVLVNLLVNAVQACDGRGTIHYGVERVEERIRPDAGRQPLARTWIRDSGPGIPDEDRNRIFDPFFTTKDRGTGLGLTVSHAIAEEHGGLIRVDNAPAGGAEFSVYVPIVMEENP